MKTTVLILSIFLFQVSSFSQINLTEIKKDSSKIGIQLNWDEDSTNYKPILIADNFLLGTLNDYMGRFQHNESNNLVDRYYPDEAAMIPYIAAFIKEKYSLIADTSVRLKIYSKELAGRLNNYYNQKGSLSDLLFKTREQASSFLLGNYYRYGEKLTNNIYVLRLANSSKSLPIYRALLWAGCKRVLYKRMESIPTVEKIYFEAPPRLIKYFNLISSEKKQMYEYKISLYKETTDWINTQRKLKQKEGESVQSVFDYEQSLLD